MAEVYDFAVWIPCCPSFDRCAMRISSAVSNGILTAIAGGFLIGLFVVIYSERLKMRGISRTLWKIYFASSTAKFGFTTLYMLFGPRYSLCENLFRMLFGVSSNVAILAISLALNHQLSFFSGVGVQHSRKSVAFLSGIPDMDGQGQLTEEEALLSGKFPGLADRGVVNSTAAKSKKSLAKTALPSLSEAFLIGLFVLNTIGLFVHLTLQTTTGWLYWIYITISVISHLPILVLTLIIVTKRGNFQPDAGTKTCLLVGVFQSFALASPITTWGYLLPTSCLAPLFFLSGYDLVVLLESIALLCFFLFVRNEYRRHQKECVSLYLNNPDKHLSYKNF